MWWWCSCYLVYSLVLWNSCHSVFGIKWSWYYSVSDCSYHRLLWPASCWWQKPVRRSCGSVPWWCVADCLWQPLGHWRSRGGLSSAGVWICHSGDTGCCLWPGIRQTMEEELALQRKWGQPDWLQRHKCLLLPRWRRICDLLWHWWDLVLVLCGTSHYISC